MKESLMPKSTKSIFLLILLMLLSQQVSSACTEATDYLSLVGSLYTNLISIYVAPNASH